MIESSKLSGSLHELSKVQNAGNQGHQGRQGILLFEAESQIRDKPQASPHTFSTTASEHCTVRGKAARSRQLAMVTVSPAVQREQYTASERRYTIQYK